MSFLLKISIYLLAVAFAVAAGIINWKRLDTAGRTIVTLLACTMANEVSTIINAYITGNNMPLYHAFAVVQLTFVIAYFMQLHKMYSTVRMLLVFVAAILAAWMNVACFEPLTHINSNFLMLESIIIIVLAVISLYRIIDNEAITRPSHNIHFWIWSFLLILWSATFFYWALYSIILGNKEIYALANIMRWALNVLAYAGTGIALMKQPMKDARKQ